MKRYVPAQEETTTKIGRFCGFTTQCGLKGYLVYMGSPNRLKAVFAEEGTTVTNTCAGVFDKGMFQDVKDFVENANSKFYDQCIDVRVKDIYFFDSLKEMHKWLSE